VIERRHGGVALAAVFTGVFEIIVRVEARHAAEEKGGQRQAGPSYRLAVPTVFALHRGCAGARDPESRATPQPELDRPRHQVQVRLPAHLAPQGEYSDYGNQK